MKSFFESKRVSQPRILRKPTHPGWQAVSDQTPQRDNGRSVPGKAKEEGPPRAEYVLPDHLNQLNLENKRGGDDAAKQLEKISGGLGSWTVQAHNIKAINAGARLSPTRPVQHGGALVTTRPDGKMVIDINHGRIQEDPRAIKELSEKSQNSWALRLEAGPNDKLIRYRADNKAFGVRDGIYPFVIDQNSNCLISFATGGESARTGGHGKLAGAYGVLFAGELTVHTENHKQRVIAFNNKSGNYLTPAQIPTFEKQARQHKLLQNALFDTFLPEVKTV